jgi:hypothetical protein
MVSSFIGFTNTTVGLRRAAQQRPAHFQPCCYASAMSARLQPVRPEWPGGPSQLCAGVLEGRRRGHRAHDERTEIEPNRAIATVIDGVTIGQPPHPLKSAASWSDQRRDGRGMALRLPTSRHRIAANHPVRAEGTRRRGLGRERPLRRCNRPNRQLGSERPAADYPLGGGGNLAVGVDLPAAMVCGAA